MYTIGPMYYVVLRLNENNAWVPGFLVIKGDKIKAVLKTGCLVMLMWEGSV